MRQIHFQNLDRVSRDVSRAISDILNGIGLMYRILYRTKEYDSIKQKIKKKGYTESGKKLQDLIGIRITLYFEDDLDIVYTILKERFDFVSETIDKWEDFEFRPIRINLIFNLNNELKQEVRETLAVHSLSGIDDTYEVQLRTVLSEGWHEVDHDLRYKCKKDWNGYSDYSRKFNSVLATLQLSDWGIKKIFEEFSYSHYKNGDWNAMLRHKFRIRLSEENMSPSIEEEFMKNAELGRHIYKLDRTEFMKKMYHKKINIPLNLDNLVFLINHFYLKNPEIQQKTPQSILRYLEQ